MNYKNLVFLILTFCSSFISWQANAQDNTGKEFWFSPPSERYTNYVVDLYIIGNYDCTVNLKYMARPTSNCTERTINIVGGVPQSISLGFPPNAGGNCLRFTDMLETPETVQQNGIRVTSTAPIALYYLHFEQASAEMMPVLPIEKMGKQYLLTAYREITGVDHNFYARGTVTAIENNTTVTFSLPTNTWTSFFAPQGMKRGPGSTWNVVLNRGETYSIICYDNQRALNYTETGSSVPVGLNQGLNGVSITADKNISVIGGSPITWIGNKQYPGCGAADITATHLPSMENWGNRFVTTQTLSRPMQMSAAVGLTSPPLPNIFPYPSTNPVTYNDMTVADYLLITAKDNGTIVNITGAANYTKTLNAGEWFIYESPGNSNPLTPPPTTSPGASNHLITSNNPIQVVQMMKGWQCDNNGPADPTQMLVREESSWKDNYIITNPTQFLNNFFAFIVKEPGAGNVARNSLNLLVGGVAVSIPTGNSPTNDGANGWTAIGTTGYYFQRLNIAAGGSIRARSVAATPGGVTYPFAFYASGSLQAASYGYMGGATCQLDVFAHADTINICESNTVTCVMDSTIRGGMVAGMVNYNYRYTIFNGATQIATGNGNSADPTFQFTPPGAGTFLGILEITDNAGCFAVDSFNILVLSSPPVATISYSKPTYCSNEADPSPTVIGTTGGTFSSTAGLVISSTTGTIDLSASTSGSYVVSYTYGIVPCTAVATYNVSVNQTPTVTVNDPTICSGSSATLTASPSIAGGSFLWSPGGETSNPITVTPSNTSNYTVTYSLNGCSSSDVSTVTVNPTPTVSSTSTTICAGSNGSITATGIPNGGSYSWTPTGQTTATLTDNPSSTTTYTVNYTLSGCAAIATGTINVEPAPTANISGGGTICEGQTSTISITLTGNAPWSITYSDGAMSQTVSGINASPYTFATSTAGTYTLSSVSNSVCSGTVSGSATVNVVSNVVVSNQSVTCNPGNADYIVSFDMSGGSPPYIVTGGPGTISGSTFTSGPITSGTSFNFNVSDGVGCNVVNVSGLQDCSCPSSAVISGGGTVCSGNPATINVNFTGTAPFTFSYTDGVNPPVGPITTGLSIYSFAVTTAGNYTLTAFNDNVCAGSRSGTAVVVVNNPTPVSVNNEAICDGETATLTATPAVVGGTYTWSPDGQTSQSINVNPSSTTTYTVTYVRNGCSSTASGTVTVNPVPTNTIADQTICEGDVATITSVASPGGGNYLWTAPSSVALSTTPSVTDSPSTTTTYTCVYELNGCEATASGVVTVEATPVVNVTASSPSNTICEGDNITLTANSTVVGGVFNWNPSPLPATQSITVSPVTTTTYDVTQTIGTCSSNSATITITVNPAVTPTAGSNSPVCSGNPINLTSSTVSGGVYSWTGPNGFTSSQQNPSIPSATLSNSGTYVVNVTANGCSGGASTNVTVNSTPVITVNATNTSICQGSSTTITATSSLGGGAFSWTPGGQSSPSITVSPMSTTTYTVNHTVNGCVSNTESITITVNPTPTASASSNSPICAGDDLLLSGSSSIPGSTFAWTGPNGFNSTSPNPVITNAQSVNAGNYSLKVTSNTCPSPSTIITVTINPVPNTNISPAGPYCTNNNPVQLTAASPGGTWSGQGITNATNGTFSPAVAGPGNHTITYSQGGSCPNSSTANIVVNEAPVITLVATPVEGCNPLTVAFDVTSTPAANSMTWTFGNGATSPTNGDLSYVYTTPGTYTVSVTATANGCSATYTANNLIQVNETPVAEFAFNVTGSAVQFENNSVSEDSYVWNFGDGTSSTDENPLHIYAASNDYEVQLLVETVEGCIDSITKTIVIEEDVLFFVPNAFSPDLDAFNNVFSPVMTSGFDPDTYRMVIFNRWGEVVFETRNHTIGWDGTYNNTACPGGLYTYRISFTDKVTDNKYVKDGIITLLR